MHRTREFWIIQHDYGTDTKADYTVELTFDDAIKAKEILRGDVFKVREIFPIDWEKLQQLYWNEGGSASENEVEIIKKLVEKALIGEL